MNYLENPEGASVTLRLNANRAALHFNAMHPIGTRVRYWADEKVGEPTGTARTNTAAYVFGDIVAAVGLEVPVDSAPNGVLSLGITAATVVVPLDNVEVIA